MNQPGTTVQGLMDIEAPLAPPDDGNILFAITATIVLVCLMLLLWKRHNSLRSQTQRKLRNQQRLFSLHPAHHHTAAYQIALALRTGLKLTRLTSTTTLPDSLLSDRTRWRRFIETLNRARYSPQACSKLEIHYLFSDAKYWLKKWPQN